MKIRTDFVTNSSSTSFIFKENYKKEIEAAVEHQRSIISREGWADYKEVMDWVKDIAGKRFCEHEIPDLLEVTYWYEDEVLNKILGIHNWKEFSVHEVNLTGDAIKRLAAKFIIDIYDFCMSKYHTREEEKFRTVSMEVLQEELWEYLANCRPSELNRYYLENLPMFLIYIEEFAGKTFGEVVECFFDAKYLFYMEWEMPFDIYHAICDALESEDLWLYSCNHMG